MNPLMLRTPHVFARPNSLDVSEIKARTATISDPDSNNSTTDSTDSTAPSRDDDLTLTNETPANWPLGANTTTIYPPITPTTHGPANEVDHWKIEDSDFSLDITVMLNHHLEETQLNETLECGLRALSQKPLTEVADDTWTVSESKSTSPSIILGFAQQTSGQQGIEPLEWRQLITLLDRPNGIWGYFAKTRRFFEIEFAVRDESRTGRGGYYRARGSVRKGGAKGTPQQQFLVG